MTCTAASTSAAGRGRAPNTPSSATMTTASMSTSPKPRGAQIARHPPPAPVEQRRGVGSEGRVFERGIDPDAQHRRLVDVGGVIAVEPPPQRALPGRRLERRDVGDLDHRRAHGLNRACREHARELVLVAEVPVERTVGDAGRGDEIVDARVVVAALDEHVAARREQGVERAVAGGVRVDRARRAGGWRASPTPDSIAGGGAPSGGCTFTSACQHRTACDAGHR